MKRETARLDLLARLNDLCQQWGVDGASVEDRLRNLSIATGIPVQTSQLEQAILLLELQTPEQSQGV